jgi:hypothetical protein
MKQGVCIKICAKLGTCTSATGTPEMLREASGEHSRFLNGIHVPRPVKYLMKVTNIQGNQAPAKQQKC